MAFCTNCAVSLSHVLKNNLECPTVVAWSETHWQLFYGRTTQRKFTRNNAACACMASSCWEKFKVHETQVLQHVTCVVGLLWKNYRFGLVGDDLFCWLSCARIARLTCTVCLYDYGTEFTHAIWDEGGAEQSFHPHQSRNFIPVRQVTWEIFAWKICMSPCRDPEFSARRITCLSHTISILNAEVTINVK